MAELQKKQELQQEQVPSQQQETNLTGSIEELAKYGGFDLLEATIEGAQNLNPDRKARRNIFLTEAGKKTEREKLKKVLSLWEKILSETEELPQMVDHCTSHADEAEKVLAANLAEAVDATRGLEQSYRNVALFFKNTESDKVKNVSFINVELDQLKDLDNTRFIDAVSTELVNNYDRLDLRTNYSLLVIPGYLGSNKVVEKWAKIAHENKAMLITDFAHLDAPDDVMEMFLNYAWPGNLREFRNVVRRSVLLTPSGKINAKVLPWEITQATSPAEPQANGHSDIFSHTPAPVKEVDLKDAAAKAEYETIMNVLKEVNFNKTKAAEILKIDRKTLYNKIKIYESL